MTATERGSVQDWVAPVRRMAQICYENGRSTRSSGVTNSHWAYWKAFCEGWGVDREAFGEPPLTTKAERSVVLAELDVLASFAVYIVFNPRSKKGNKVTNSVDYALNVISTVRSHYAANHGRTPGRSNLVGADYRFKRIVQGLRKEAPHQKVRKTPLLQHHLRALKANMDLEGSQRERTIWALWLTQWQGVLRSADLVKPAALKETPWVPERETHRGRMTVEQTVLDGHNYVRFRLSLKPTKTDQAGELGFEKTFLVDKCDHSLSAGNALYNMLSGDPETVPLVQTPLFRDPSTGKEVTIEDSSARLRKCLTASGLQSLNATPHCLRVGGATAYANCPSGGDLVSGFMGLWVSDAKRDYQHALTPTLERAGLAVARDDGQELAVRPGPVSAYANGRVR